MKISQIKIPPSIKITPNEKINKPTTTVATSEIDNNKKIELLNKLKSDLVLYKNYLNRTIIDKSIWVNDIQYINTRLNTCLGLTDFTVNGISLVLKEYTKDLEGINGVTDDIVLNYAKIQSYSIISTSPIQIKNKDVLTYNLDFYKKGRKVETREYSFLIKGGFKIDFSTGFTYNTLKDKSYQIIDAGNKVEPTYYIDKFFNTTDSIVSTTTVNLKSIELLKKDISIGVSALMHFYSRSGNLINYGGTFGFVLNTNAEFNYLLGGSLIFGQKQRFIFNSGLAFGQVNQLNPKYNAEKIYTESQLSGVSDSQLTIKKWDMGYFFGISYNLGSINRKE